MKKYFFIILLVFSCNDKQVYQKIKSETFLTVVNPKMYSIMLDGKPLFREKNEEKKCGLINVLINSKIYEEYLEVCNKTNIKYKNCTIFQCRQLNVSYFCEVITVHTFIVSNNYCISIELGIEAPKNPNCKRKYIPNKLCDETNPEKTGQELAKQIVDYLNS